MLIMYVAYFVLIKCRSIEIQKDRWYKFKK